MKKLAVVIPHITQKPEHLQMLWECLNSLERFHSQVDYKVIVVDDGSPQYYRQELEGECKRRKITYLFNERNSGFPQTVNKGIEYALAHTDCAAVVVCNNDIVFYQDALSHFAPAFLTHPRVGIVGSLLFYPHKTIQHGGMMRAGESSFLHRGWHKTIAAAPEVTKTEYLIGVTGALFGMRREMLEEIGCFRDEYFLAFDDTELCLRAWSRGWRVLYHPAIEAIHKEGATRGRTNHEKQAHHRLWFVKEMETMQKFLKDVRSFNIGEIELQVAAANAELMGFRKPGVSVHSDRMVFEKQSLEDNSLACVRSDQGKRLVVKRTGALGDVILTTAIVRRLKQLRRDVSIIVCTHCPDAYYANPHVDGVVSSLNGISYDELIDLDMSYEKKPHQPIVQSYAQDALGETGFDLRPEMFHRSEDRVSLLAKLQRNGLDYSLRPRIAVCHMSVGWPSRTWPRSRWNETTKSLSAMGFKVVVIGRGADHRSDLHAGVINMVDMLSVPEIHVLMTLASVFVGIDSGMLHVAQTTDVPIVGLFTVANPAYRIVSRKSKSIALIPRSDCRFCLHDQTPPVTYVQCKYGTNHCLGEIAVSDVCQAVNESAKT